MLSFVSVQHLHCECLAATKSNLLIYSITSRICHFSCHSCCLDLPSPTLHLLFCSVHFLSTSPSTGDQSCQGQINMWFVQFAICPLGSLDEHSLFFSKHFSNVKGKKNERIQRKTVNTGVEVVKTLFDTYAYQIVKA